MHKFEKLIYNKLKHNPRLKLLVRNIYQQIFDLLPVPAPQSAYPVTARKDYFFGFHDHTPFSYDNKMLLTNKYSIPLRMPIPGEPLEIGFFHGNNFNSYEKVAQTKAWNWHMGCKLQWKGNSNQIVFNDHINGDNLARIVDLDTGIEQILPDTIGSVSPDGRWAVGFSYSRLAKCMPGYGYHFITGDTELEITAPVHHGIHRINLETEERKMLFSVAEMANISPEASMAGAQHFFMHTIFSPDSNRFVFLHRWTKGDVDKRWSRLITCDIDGKNIYIFPTIDMVSHIAWRDAKHLLAYCRTAEYDDQYVLFRDQMPKDFVIIGHDKFSSDGHPSYDQSTRWIVTDTYPDRRRRQRLIVFDTTLSTRYDLCVLPMPKKFQSPSLFRHWSCDLHPRWDRIGRYICFDATHVGERSLCTIDLGEELQQGNIKYLSKK